MDILFEMGQKNEDKTIIRNLKSLNVINVVILIFVRLFFIFLKDEGIFVPLKVSPACCLLLVNFLHQLIVFFLVLYSLS